MIVIEEKNILTFLQSRQLLLQYQKAKRSIEQNNFKMAGLKKRKPFTDNVWYFRINKQYHAHAYRHEGKLIVFFIDNHQ